MALFIRNLEPAPATALALASGHHAHPDHPEDLEHPENLNFLNMVDILHIRGHRPRIRSHINRPVVVTGMIGMIETLIIPVYSCHHPSDWDDARNFNVFFFVGPRFFLSSQSSSCQSSHCHPRFLRVPSATIAHPTVIPVF